MAAREPGKRDATRRRFRRPTKVLVRGGEAFRDNFGTPNQDLAVRRPGRAKAAFPAMAGLRELATRAQVREQVLRNTSNAQLPLAYREKSLYTHLGYRYE